MPTASGPAPLLKRFSMTSAAEAADAARTQPATRNTLRIVPLERVMVGGRVDFASRADSNARPFPATGLWQPRDALSLSAQGLSGAYGGRFSPLPAAVMFFCRYRSWLASAGECPR